MALEDMVLVTKNKLDNLANELKTLIQFTGKKTLDELTEEVARYDPRPGLDDATGGSAQMLKPYTAYGKSGKFEGTIESIAARIYAPSAEQQVIPAGKYLSGDQTIRALRLQNKTVAPSDSDTTVACDVTYDALGQVVVKGMRHKLFVSRIHEADEVSTDKRKISLDATETAAITSAPSLIYVCTSGPFSEDCVYQALSAQGFSYYSTVLRGVISQNVSEAYIKLVQPTGSNAYLELTSAVTKNFLSARYTVLILGGESS